MEPALAEPIPTAYISGMCSPDRESGGWGFVIKNPNGTNTTGRGLLKKTNNMAAELQGFVRVLRAVPTGTTICVHPWGEYISRGVLEWLPNWEKRNFKKARGEAVKNQALWKQVSKLLETRHVTFGVPCSGTKMSGAITARELADDATKMAQEEVRLANEKRARASFERAGFVPETDGWVD